MRWIARALAAVVVLAAGMGGAQTPGAKLALVVGVSEYGRERAAQEAAGFVVPPPLANAVRDAELVASALESKGFTVTRVTNPDKRALLSAVNTFAASLNRAGGDAVGLFYFAGHGAQGRPALERDIDNYLIPLDADLATEVDLESEALALSRISAALRPAAQGAVVLILDACRDFALPAASRSGLVTRGLAEARAAPGTIIAYATSPGATALDALPGQSNGPYATALAAEIRRAHGARLEDVFIATRNRVLTATRNTQTPWENGSLRRAVILGFALTDTYSQPVPLPAGAFPGLEEVYALLAREVAAQIVSSQDLYRNPKPLVALGDLQNRTVNNALHPQRIAQVLLETLVASGQVSPSANGDYLLNLQLYESAEWRSVGSGIRSYGLSAVILARNGRILSTWSSERRYRDNSPPPAGSLKPQAKTQP